MRIKCGGCGGWHDITPTGLAVVVEAFQEGDLTMVLPQEHHTKCILVAFEDVERLKVFATRYKGNIIGHDGVRY